MTQIANNYGAVLYELGVSEEVIEETRKRMSLTTELPQILCSPITSKEIKQTLIERIFPQEIQTFLKVLCDHQSMELWEEICCSYRAYADRQNGILYAELYYVTAPMEYQLTQIKAYLAKKYQKKQVKIELTEKPELIGGFVLRVGDMEEDWSMRGRLNDLKQKLIWR